MESSSPSENINNNSITSYEAKRRLMPRTESVRRAGEQIELSRGRVHKRSHNNLSDHFGNGREKVNYAPMRLVYKLTLVTKPGSKELLHMQVELSPISE